MGGGVVVRAAAAEDMAFVEEALGGVMGATDVVAHGELIRLTDTDVVVAWLDGVRAGVLSYWADGDGGWEIVTLVATRPGVGAGGALIDWVIGKASEHGVRRVWLITTNDNTHALRFYQRRGFDLVRIDHGAVDRSRIVKPSIPLENDGIPIRHELELELFPTPSE
ncbi:GNAT family N-acetyltransferase [Actinoplanes sp. NPDC049265]|uniref:GNAT family N-acetyltransferase n=1 Tax=Actinoplanes sp. NPDC049265 TaxID=3363902 RepID=UPI00371E3927